MKRCKSKGKKRLVQVITTGGEQQGKGRMEGREVGGTGWGGGGGGSDPGTARL